MIVRLRLPTMTISSARPSSADVAALAERHPDPHRRHPVGGGHLVGELGVQHGGGFEPRLA